MPAHQGIGPMPMHLFTRDEVVKLLRTVGFEIVDVRSVATSGMLRRVWWLPRLRTYGYLIAARKIGG